MGCIDAKLFVHPAQQTWVKYVPHFCRLTCGPIGRSLRRALSTWSTNEYDIHSHWIYIQRPTCTFNLSSSSSSVTGTAWSGLRRLAALLSTHRCEALPHCRPGYPSSLPVILHRLQPHDAPELVITLLLVSIYDSTAASSHLRVVPVRGLAVVHRLAAFGAAWSTNESHRKRTVRGEPNGQDPRGPWSHASSSLLS